MIAEQLDFDKQIAVISADLINKQIQAITNANPKDLKKLVYGAWYSLSPKIFYQHKLHQYAEWNCYFEICEKLKHICLEANKTLGLILKEPTGLINE